MKLRAERKLGGRAEALTLRNCEAGSGAEEGGEEAVAGVASGQALGGGEDGGSGGFDDILILFAFEGAGGVDQEPIGFQKLQRVGEDGGLAGLEVLDIRGGETPFDFGIAGEGAGTGAGGVDQDAVEAAGEGERAGGIDDGDGDSEGLQHAGTAGMEIAGDGVEGRFEGLRGFVAGGGAEIEERLAGPEIEQRDHGLRADVLEAESARRQAGFEGEAAGDVGGRRAFGGRGVADSNVAFGRLEGGAGYVEGGFFSESGDPAFEQPAGSGGGFGDFGGLAEGAAQDGVDEGGSRCFPGAAGEFDGIVNGGVVGDAVEETDLIKAHADGEADGFVEFSGGTFGVFVD